MSNVTIKVVTSSFEGTRHGSDERNIELATGRTLVIIIIIIIIIIITDSLDMYHLEVNTPTGWILPGVNLLELSQV